MLSKLLKKKNYLAMIENAAKGENWMFRNLYAEVDEKPFFKKASKGKEIDIANNGRWSCAIFVSSVLYLHKLIGDVHANVPSTTEDMLKSGWFEIQELKPGAVLVWEAIMGEDDNKPHGHNGFYIGNEMAVSNNSRKTGFPWKHHYTYNDTRKIEKILWHPELELP